MKEKYKTWLDAEPFCKWLVFERQDEYSSVHGPNRFSLLYLCSDGVAAYQALYVANGLKPDILAIIYPGTGFGLNWTDFRDENKALARTVLGNPAGKPDYLIYYEGESRSKAIWPRHYGEQVGWLSTVGREVKLSLWKLSE